jgi:hypothetical protein
LGLALAAAPQLNAQSPIALSFAGSPTVNLSIDSIH